MAMFSKDLGIDLGTFHTRLAESGQVLLEEPTIVAIAVQEQKIVSVARKDQDVVAFARDDGQACVQVFFIRGGKIIGREYFVLEGASGVQDVAVLEAFLQQFYDEAAYVPPEILMPPRMKSMKI